MKNTAINYASLAKGQILINLDESIKQKNLSIVFDGNNIPLYQIESDDLSEFGLKQKADFFSKDEKFKVQVTDLQGLPISDLTACHLDLLQDWSLEGKKTLQIQIDSPGSPKRIIFSQPQIIKVNDICKSFQVYLAAHRSVAKFIVQFENLNSGEEVFEEIPVGRHCIGGRSVETYQPVELTIPFTNCQVKIQCVIEFVEYISDGSDSNPFFFIADASISEVNTNPNSIRPREILNFSDANGTWMHADGILVKSSNNCSILLKVDDETFDIFPNLSEPVQLVADYGHTLQVQSSIRQNCFLKIDETLIHSVLLVEGITSLRIPKDYLRGEVICLEILDYSCSQQLLTVQVLAPKILTPHEVMASESRSPLPTDLTLRANQRYQGLRRHLIETEQKTEPSSLKIALDTLDQTYDTLKLRPISFCEVKDPDVSVIIPAHNKVNVTYYGLCALLVAQNNCTIEVVLVDDGSSDETKNLHEIVSGITIIRNEDPQRFIRSCNAGVQKSKGRYIVLLNNDTEVTAGWLDELITAFNRFDKVGLVGSKLLYPDGRLQDGGGLIWRSGTPWNYGHGQNPWKPEFCYARQVDYLSGAAMLTTRKIWNEVGGLSSYLEPMYFEDTDLAFKVREAGYKTYYVPSSVVYHFEGATSGTDLSSGFKKYQAINFPKFKRQWAKAFRSFGKKGERPDLEKDRGIVGRVLFIDYTTPREDRDAGSYAARREIELVQSLGYKVTFLPENLAHFGAYTDDLQKSGVEVIVAPFYLSITDYLEEHAADFDAFYITRYYVAQNTIPLIRKHAPGAKIILNNADLHFLRELRAGLSENNPARLDSMRLLREQELDMMKRADLVLSYNEVEHAVITSHTDGQARVMECPWVVTIPPEGPSLKKRSGLSFLGSFNHTPNGEGLKWFCAEVMPLLADTDIELSIYGSGMRDDIKALASDMIKPVGFIEDISDAYHRHRVFVAPLLSGAGIKGKVVSALAHGIPAVLSPVAAEGIGLRDGLECVIVDKPKDWEKAIRQLMTDTALWNRMSKAARSYAASRFSFEQGRAKMKEAFEAVDLYDLD